MTAAMTVQGRAMDKPVRVQLSRRKGWRMPPNTVSVARPGRWGNPIIVRRLAGLLWDTVTSAWAERWVVDAVYWPRPMICPSRADAVALAVQRFRDDIAPTLDLPHLRGKNLACWCALDQLCHADVLLELANE